MKLDCPDPFRRARAKCINSQLYLSECCSWLKHQYDHCTYVQILPSQWRSHWCWGQRQKKVSQQLSILDKSFKSFVLCSYNTADISSLIQEASSVTFHLATTYTNGLRVFHLRPALKAFYIKESLTLSHCHSFIGVHRHQRQGGGIALLKGATAVKKDNSLYPLKFILHSAFHMAQVTQSASPKATKRSTAGQIFTDGPSDLQQSTTSCHLHTQAKCLAQSFVHKKFSAILNIYPRLLFHRFNMKHCLDLYFKFLTVRVCWHRFMKGLLRGV